MSFNHFTITFLLAGAVAFAVCRYAWVNNIWPFQSELQMACEERLLSRLVSPSSFKRISVRETKTEIDAAAFEKMERQEISREQNKKYQTTQYRLLEFDLKEMNAGTKKVYRLKTTIEFDASNKLGVMLRGFARCGYVQKYERPTPNAYLIDFELDL